MTKYRHIDTARPDGCYVTFERLTHEDSDSDPRDYLFQDPDYLDEDQKRLDDWHADKWRFVGIQARAHILIVRNGSGTMHEMTSAGVWGIESDSGDQYLNLCFADEKDDLLADMRALSGSPVIEAK